MWRVRRVSAIVFCFSKLEGDCGILCCTDCLFLRRVVDYRGTHVPQADEEARVNFFSEWRLEWPFRSEDGGEPLGVGMYVYIVWGAKGNPVVRPRSLDRRSTINPEH